MAWSSGAAPMPFPDPSPPPPYQLWQSGSEVGPELLYPQYASQMRDPRSSSTQSLVPSFNEGNHRRTLLIVYIHGFMGDNTSFRSFPAHVHNYLKDALAESHVIHSKIYPKYKTYKAIEVARDNFSKWLEPHESPSTDIILVGHSMGGLLAADVALMPSTNPVYGHPFKHRILGTISLDAPLLGLHPGIIKSGIASLFRKAPDPPWKGQELAESLDSQNASWSWNSDDGPSVSSDTGPSSGMTSPAPLTTIPSSASSTPQSDPNFNPAYFNDVPLRNRGLWMNMAHFAKKHYSEGLFSSTYQHLLSHLEFGSCLADYASLNSRYNKIRRLEDVDELSQSNQRREARIRFVNYYTASTGIPKEQKDPPTLERVDTHLRSAVAESRPALSGNSNASTPRISIEDYSDGERPQLMQLLEPVPEPDSQVEDGGGQASDLVHGTGESKPPGSSNGGKNTNSKSWEEEDKATGPAAANEDAAAAAESRAYPEKDEANNQDNDLQAIPSLPDAPQAPDFDKYTDKDARKQAEKEFKRVQKVYNQAVKNREKAIKERQKLVEKRRKKAQKETEKRDKEEKRLAKQEQERIVREAKEEARESEQPSQAAAAQSRTQVTAVQAEILERQLTELAFHDGEDRDVGTDGARSRSPTSPESPQRTRESNNTTDSKKLRKFCMLPQKTGGVRDPKWVQVYMEGVDEVGAHCGLFFPGPHYERLIGEFGSRIVGWVQEDASKRAILEMI